jgi:hypothetical protein
MSTTEPTTIDLTPTWAAILPALIAVIRDGTPDGQRLALEELRRMATAADRLNELAKEPNA